MRINTAAPEVTKIDVLAMDNIKPRKDQYHRRLQSIGFNSPDLNMAKTLT